MRKRHVSAERNRCLNKEMPARLRCTDTVSGRTALERASRQWDPCQLRGPQIFEPPCRMLMYTFRVSDCTEGNSLGGGGAADWCSRGGLGRPELQLYRACSSVQSGFRISWMLRNRTIPGQTAERPSGDVLLPYIKYILRWTREDGLSWPYRNHTSR